MSSSGIFQAQDYEGYLSEGANWTFFKETLGMCVTEGSPGKFLDVGCGLGFFVECCQRYGISCEGLEGSTFAVERAAERGVKLIRHDLSSNVPFPFPSQSFSAVLLSQVVEHLPVASVQHILSETYRCLIAGGIAVILTPSLYNPKERNDPEHCNLYTPSRIRREVEACGFQFRRFLNNWPRNVFTHTELEYFLWRQFCRFAKPDWLSQGASCIVVRP